MWFHLREHLKAGATEPAALVVDFYADSYLDDFGPGPQPSVDTEWNYPVYWYRVNYGVYDYGNSDTAEGNITLRYEDHVYGVDHAHGDAWYTFRCAVHMDEHGNWGPIEGTGRWLAERHGPSPHGQPLTTVPDKATYITGRAEGTNHNPYVVPEVVDSIWDHKLIVLDNEYGGRLDPENWVDRPGFSGGCWAHLGTPGLIPTAELYWHIPGTIPEGTWEVSIYMTPPAPGDIMNTQTQVKVFASGVYAVNQGEGGDDWRHLANVDLQNWSGGFLEVMNNLCYPDPCLIYGDAMRMDLLWTLEGGDGPTAAGAVGVSQCPRVMPNPVRTAARIRYSVSKPGPVDVAIYDVTGRSVLRVPQDVKCAGIQSATVSVAGLTTGTYIARVTGSGSSSTCRFVVCR